MAKIPSLPGRRLRWLAVALILLAAAAATPLAQAASQPGATPGVTAVVGDGWG